MSENLNKKPKADASPPLKRIVKLPLPENMERMENGSVQFGDDWPGVFLRGDSALWYAHAIDMFLAAAKVELPMMIMQLENLRDELQGCKAT